MHLRKLYSGTGTACKGEHDLFVDLVLFPASHKSNREGRCALTIYLRPWHTRSIDRSYPTVSLPEPEGVASR